MRLRSASCRKMAPVIVNYAQTTGFGMIVDTSNPWPQGPVLWALPSMDITRAVVEAYNAKSGVPAPAKPAAPPQKRSGEAGSWRQAGGHCAAKAANYRAAEVAGDTGLRKVPKAA